MLGWICSWRVPGHRQSLAELPWALTVLQEHSVVLFGPTDVVICLDSAGRHLAAHRCTISDAGLRTKGAIAATGVENGCSRVLREAGVCEALQCARTGQSADGPHNLRTKYRCVGFEDHVDRDDCRHGASSTNHVVLPAVAGVSSDTPISILAAIRSHDRNYYRLVVELNGPERPADSSAQTARRLLFVIFSRAIHTRVDVLRRQLRRA